MSALTEKVSYIRGLADGLDLDVESKEGKIISAMLDLLADMAQEMEETADAQDELFEAVSDLDEAMHSVAEILADDEEGGCSCCSHDHEDFCPPVLTVRCPACNETVEFDAEDVDEDGFVVCPYCDEEIEIEFDEDEEDSDDDLPF